MDISGRQEIDIISAGNFSFNGISVDAAIFLDKLFATDRIIHIHVFKYFQLPLFLMNHPRYSWEIHPLFYYYGEMLLGLTIKIIFQTREGYQ